MIDSTSKLYEALDDIDEIILIYLEAKHINKKEANKAEKAVSTLGILLLEGQEITKNPFLTLEEIKSGKYDYPMEYRD